jgi:hypothetical protein
MALPKKNADAIADARQARDASQSALEDEIVAGWKAKGGVREIADAAEMTHRGIALILQRRGVRKILSQEETDRARRELDGGR